jgi:hypothetical protein
MSKEVKMSFKHLTIEESYHIQAYKQAGYIYIISNLKITYYNLLSQYWKYIMIVKYKINKKVINEVFYF